MNHDPDIAVIQECENPATVGNWAEFTDWAWIGENDDKGLGVFTRNGIEIDSFSEFEESRFAMLVETGVVDLVAVWAMNSEDDPRQRYIGQVHIALTNHPEVLENATPVIGDFNWNAIWDESPDSPLYGDFSDVVRILNEHGLPSAYHQISGAEFGDEDSPTFYMHKKAERPYHIDYAVLPISTIESADISVGKYDEWIDASDHIPVTIDC